MHADNDVYDETTLPEHIELAAEVLRILSDPTRIRIILALRKAGEMSVGALAGAVRKKPSGVSQHLARLRMARMVTTRQRGTSVLYRLTDEHAAALVTEAIKQAEHAVANGKTPPHHHLVAAPNAAGGPPEGAAGGVPAPRVASKAAPAPGVASSRIAPARDEPALAPGIASAPGVELPSKAAPAPEAAP